VLPRLQVLLLVAACASAAACAPKLMKLPEAGGPAASDGRDAFTDATAGCRDVRTLSAAVAVNGSVASQRVRGRLLVGVAAPGSARIEAVAPFGQPLFIFVTRARDATLLLPRDRRVLTHGAPDAVLEAIAGIPLDAEQLRRVLVACPAVPDVVSVRAPADDWRVVVDGPDETYLHRDPRTAPWQVAATLHRRSGPSGWRTEYRDFQGGLPRTIRLVSLDSRRFDLQLALSQVERNAVLGPEVFTVDVPADAAPITIDELREAGPLARPGVREN
jgi:outer membrane lipoprotein-sorting protein